MKNQIKINAEKNIEFNKIIKDLIENETVKSMNNYLQHYDTTCYEHCYIVSYYCYCISKKLGWDYKSAARGAMLHDLFLYNWRERQDDRKGFHAFTHGKKACENACKIFDLNKKEKDMIKNHMFPVTLIPPKSKEGMLLTFVDKFCAMRETYGYLYRATDLKIRTINKYFIK